MGWYKVAGSRLVTRYWPGVLAGWIALALLLRFFAPTWDSIAADGDLAFLPATVPSVVGQRQLDAAFPGASARSQMVIVLARRSAAMTDDDTAVGLDIARRLHMIASRNEWEKLPQDKPQWSADTLTATQQSSLEAVQDNLTQCIEIGDVLAGFQAQEGKDSPRLFLAYEMRGRLYERLNKKEESSRDFETSKLLAAQKVPILEEPVRTWSKAIHDVWTWRDGVLGHKFGSNNRHAKLIAIQLSNEFTAVSNIALLEGVERLVEEVRAEHGQDISSDLEIGISGSAAVGADMLRAAAGSVKQTEGVTVLLVLVILTLVYRGPFLVAIPLTSIALSLIIATGVLALLARDPSRPGSFGLGVFTTTRIFIVVLLFGAGTDFCLFFLARCREILEKQATPTRSHFYRAVGRAWRSVHNALVASAMTTIVGLALMWVSRFEKFRYSGPIIAISLAVTLLVCLTFTPALLSAVGRVAFWPSLRPSPNRNGEHRDKFWNRFWFRVGTFVVRYPAPTLVLTMALLAVPAYHGWNCLGWVTYNFAEELSADAPSRRGTELLSRYFPPNSGSPVTLILVKPEEFAGDDDVNAASDELAKSLYVSGVESVRSLNDPLGDYPPQRWMSLFSQDSWRRRVLKLHRVSRGRYLSSVDGYQKRLAKFDIVLKDNPFSLEASSTLGRILDMVQKETQDAESPWYKSRMTVAGTTVGITDLRTVTQADQHRIQLLVTVGVWIVLLFLVRHWGLATYLIFTVLLSYFSTLGFTYAVFSWLYGAEYNGLDWKVPLFLFVILVAVGQDYNVYLTTRIFEEQRTYPGKEGIRRALGLTGGIITSCGAVMAGTFIAMASPAVSAWLSENWPSLGIHQSQPVLRGITEMGFALSLGVMLDTLVIRSLLVPAYFAARPQRQVSKV
ncbi:MAG: MMPL family transporter [Pirellulales bacterium]